MADDDPYDFSGVNEDLQTMKSQLLALKPMQNQVRLTLFLHSYL